MRIKRVVVLVLACVILICLSGCEKRCCTMNVVSSYSGYGIDGQDLGSGSFSDTFTVYPGDVFYEDAYGHWNKDGKDKYEAIISITEINDDGVIIKASEEKIAMPYKSSKHIKSRYDVCDGRNYEYSISFTNDQE